MLLLSALLNLAHAEQTLSCPKDLLNQASEAFPEHECHLGVQEPGGFAVFCNQRIDGVLTDTEIPIFIGLDTYRFKEVPDGAKSQVWAYIAQKFMHLSNTDFIETTKSAVTCEGPNIFWWTVETHLPVDDVTRHSTGSGKRSL